MAFLERVLSAVEGKFTAMPSSKGDQSVLVSFSWIRKALLSFEFSCFGGEGVTILSTTNLLLIDWGLLYVLDCGLYVLDCGL